MSTTRRISLWPAVIATIILTGLGAWMILDSTQLPGASTISRWCIAAVLVLFGLSLLIGDYNVRNHR